MKHIVSFLLLAATSFLFAFHVLADDCPVDSATYDIQQGRLHLPGVLVEQQGLLFEVQLDLLNSKNLFQFQLTDLKALVNLPATGHGSYQVDEGLLHIDTLCLLSDVGIQYLQQVELQLIPNSKPMQFLLRSVFDSAGDSVFNWAVAGDKGALQIKDRQAFERLAAVSDVTGVTGVREMKFVIVDLDSEHPVLFFMNSEMTPLHYDFVRDVLKRYQSLDYGQGSSKFIAETYFREQRNHLAGSVVVYDNFNDTENSQQQGLYALEFWPTDPVPQELIERAYHTISVAMPFLPAPLAYHPVGNTHESNYAGFAEQFAAKNIRAIDTDSLFAKLDSAVLNTGEAYGLLKIINPGDLSPGEEVIAIYTFIPNDLGHVGGIITEQPQTPLSHINLKARQNDTPNAYMKNVLKNPEIEALIGQWVHYTVDGMGVHIESATEQEALTWLAGKIPAQVTIPESDLSVTVPRPLSDLVQGDWIRVGVKAANVAELGKILPEGVAPKGYALPFAMYDAFMRSPRCPQDMTVICESKTSLSFYDYISALLLDEEFANKQLVREQRLAEFREIIENADAPQFLIDQIEQVRLFWEPAGEPFSQSLRVRSSTNNEDLPGFNGAGLYGSFTHKPKEGKLINSVKQVWASLWTARAFEERRLHRIDHLHTYMGVLIHPNYGDEQVNGVAISKNIYNPDWEGFYVNAQYGELSITNPEPIDTDAGLITPIPDEFLITRLAASVSGLAWETQFIRHSNIVQVYGEPVMTDNVLTAGEIEELRDNLQIIHAHFKALYQGDKNFAMDIEFKITETDDGSRGSLAIKQARPWVD